MGLQSMVMGVTLAETQSQAITETGEISLILTAATQSEETALGQEPKTEMMETLSLLTDETTLVMWKLIGSAMEGHPLAQMSEAMYEETQRR